jgi:hypothetical protein
MENLLFRRSFASDKFDSLPKPILESVLKIDNKVKEFEDIKIAPKEF